MKKLKYLLVLALAAIVFMPATAMARSPHINFSFNVDFLSRCAPRGIVVAPRPVMVPCPPPAPVFYYPVARERMIVKNYYYLPYMPY